MTIVEPGPPGWSEPSGQQVVRAATELDGPQLELDQLLAQLIDRAQDVRAAHGRLRGLLHANSLITGDLTLPVVLRRIVEAACELVDAQYGALGVIATSGSGLEQFIHVGVDEDQVALIGHLPEGKGLLGALIDDPRPIRLRTLSSDPRSAGFPRHHPPMDSFLGVPILVRDTIFGNLYLAGARSGEFSVEDQELVSSLAASAGVAIENARLYEQARRRQDWLQAATDITRQLLTNEGEDPLELIARRTRQIADADLVAVLLPSSDGERLMVEVATGVSGDELKAVSYPVEHTYAGQVISTGQPVLIADLQAEQARTQLVPIDVGALMVLPLGSSQRVRGALIVCRLRGRAGFADADLEMATTFANHAAIALELADARADQQRVVLLEDRDRIARDLHDHVIQRLFAAGLSVESIAAAEADRAVGRRLGLVVTDIDDTIRQIRMSIFQLRGPLVATTSRARAELLAVAAEVSPLLGFDPQLSFTGPVDAVTRDDLVPDLTAVVREALTNAARHAQASMARVEVRATGNDLTVEITDDGVGVGAVSRRSGLDNLRRRAEQHGGSFELISPVADPSPTAGKGTYLRWRIPIT
ncbi:MAG: GAF domain-containing protein [Jatrophihabitantaceae bacterium]